MSSISAPLLADCCVPDKIFTGNKVNNSTSPLPQFNKQRKEKPHDITMLYKQFTSVVTEGIRCKQRHPVPDSIGAHCYFYCCEQSHNNNKKPHQRQKHYHHNHHCQHNKHTAALFYESAKVREYMKTVMDQSLWNDIVCSGFPCPHVILRKSSADSASLCVFCDDNARQDTLRLTLTPPDYRMQQDRSIYIIHQVLLDSDPRLRSTKSMRRRGRVFF